MLSSSQDLGVPPKHIAYLEGQTIQGYGLPLKVFDYLGRVNNVIIPTHLIIGSHLEGNIGHDWIDLMKYAFCDDYQNRSMIQVTQKRYQWLPTWYVKNRISSKMKFDAYSNAFLMKQDDVWDYIKWHLLYDYKLKK